MATDSSQHKHTAKAEGQTKWDQSKIGQAGQFQPDNYFVVDHTKTLNLSTFTITVWVKFFEGTGGGEQNIVHKQEGKDRSTRNYTIKIWEGTPFSFLPARAIRCPQVAWYFQDNRWQLGITWLEVTIRPRGFCTSMVRWRPKRILPKNPVPIRPTCASAMALTGL